MDKSNPLSTPMFIRSMSVKKDPFCPRKNNEEVFDPEVPYLSAIGALMYLANCSRPDITFATNLLVRFSSSSTRRYWNGIKNVFCYLQGTANFSLLYSKGSK